LADDTTLFFNSKSEISLALNEIEIFGSFSGLIMNKDKTEGLWIGKLKHCKDKVGGIKWTDKPVKTLGIYFGHDKEECENLNWENKIEKINNLLLLWTKRNLTILGKILLIKFFLRPPFSSFPTTVFRSTLSGLLFQINLKHLLSISFLYFFGTTQALATYVNIGIIKDLIIKTFPKKIVKFLFVHKSNKLFTFFYFIFPS
jgi:hypothetical protein